MTQNNPIDDELKQLAKQALKNDFWRTFSSLVNSYVAAAQGLSDDQGVSFVDELNESTSVYQTDVAAPADFNLNIYVEYHTGAGNGSCGYSTLKEALLDDDASVIMVNGIKVFERNNGQWVLP
jgi:hypothetical protein